MFCWLYAKHHGGEFVLRIEDTDRERSSTASVDAILDGMSWLGLDCDDGPLFQTDRFERYSSVAADWLESGKAYRCYCTREELDAIRADQMQRGVKTRYDGRCRHRTEPRVGVEPVIRFRNPDSGPVVVRDQVRGDVEFDNSELDDLIIVRSDGTPTYNFTVVIDDSDMRITHVIRGDDHLNNTPRQMNMLATLGAETPVYAHLPMILGPDGARLSKRHGAVDVLEYRTRGYLPNALLNYLARLGWSHGDQELFTVAELIALFDLAGVNRSASSFNPEKLEWVNQQHVIGSDPADLAELLAEQLLRIGVDPANGPELASVAAAFIERSPTIEAMARNAAYCFVDSIEPDAAAWKKHLRPVILEPFDAVIRQLEATTPWARESILSAIEETAGKFDIKMGKLGQPLRVAATGTATSPPIDTTLELIGRERVLERLQLAAAYLHERAGSTS